MSQQYYCAGGIFTKTRAKATLDLNDTEQNPGEKRADIQAEEGFFVFEEV